MRNNMSMIKRSIALLVLVTVPLIGQTFSSAPHDFIMARMAADEGDYDRALKLLDQVLEANPNDPVVLYERASTMLDARSFDRAEMELKKLVSTNPDFYDAQRLLGRLLLDRSGGERRKVEQALLHLRAAFNARPDDIASGMMVAQILIGSDRLGDAEKIISTMLERFPDNRALNYSYAQLLTKLGRGNESQTYLERVIAADPSYGPAVLQLVDVYQRTGEWKRAADLLDPMIEEDPSNLELQRQQAVFYLRGGESEKAKARLETLLRSDQNDEKTRFFLAEALNELQEFGTAEEIYRSLLKNDPSSPDVQISLGLNLMAQRKYDQATGTFQSLIENTRINDAGRMMARTQLAVIDYQKGDYQSALKRALEVTRGPKQANLQALNVALSVYRRDKQYQQAVDLLKPLIDEFGSDPYLNARYMEFLLRSGDQTRGRTVANETSKTGKRGAMLVAESYVSLEEFAHAIDILEKLRQGEPRDVDVLFQLGSAYERAGRVQQAENAFLDLLNSEPAHAPSLNYLGYMWADRNINLDRAADMIERAVKQEPRNGAFIDSLGWVYFRQGKLDLAERYLADAAKLMPRDPTILEHLGDLFARRGQLGRALESYRKALLLEPEPKDEQKLRSKIGELERQSAMSPR